MVKQLHFGEGRVKQDRMLYVFQDESFFFFDSSADKLGGSTAFSAVFTERTW